LATLSLHARSGGPKSRARIAVFAHCFTCSRDAIAGLDRPLMVFHSPLDTVVSVDNSRRIFEAARHPKSFVSLDGADHLLSRSADGAYVARILSAWSTRYL
jgi:putative redox protein